MIKYLLKIKKFKYTFFTWKTYSFILQYLFCIYIVHEFQYKLNSNIQGTFLYTFSSKQNVHVV